MKSKLSEAVNYLQNNPTLSFHHASVKFGVNADVLLKAWRELKKVTQ